MKEINSCRIHSFPPLVHGECRILILGSMPGRRSLEEQAYYAYPQNAFWRIMAALFSFPADAPYAERCESLLEHSIALWDVCASCEREGSLDMHIRDVLPNDIPGLLCDAPHIRRILCNGKTAHTLLGRYFPALRERAVLLPSTSPANTLPFAEKLALWRNALEATS